MCVHVSALVVKFAREMKHRSLGSLRFGDPGAPVSLTLLLVYARQKNKYVHTFVDTQSEVTRFD